jgi:hypothetical protein
MASKDMLRAIGAVMVNWGTLDHQLSTMTALLMMDPATAKCDLPPARFAQRADFFVSLCTTCFPNFPTIASRVSLIMSRAKVLGKQRDMIAHAWWLQTGPEALLIIDRKRMKQIFTATGREVDDLASEIKALHSGLLDIFLMWGHRAPADLTSQEKQALQAFHKSHLEGRHDPNAIKGPRPPPSFRA